MLDKLENRLSINMTNRIKNLQIVGREDNIPQSGSILLLSLKWFMSFQIKLMAISKNEFKCFLITVCLQPFAEGTTLNLVGIITLGVLGFICDQT